jgi:hypothetical protein
MTMHVPDQWWGIAVPVAAGFAVVGLLLIARWLRGVDDDGRERVLLVGVSPLMVDLVAEIEARPELRWRIVGVVGDLARQARPRIGPWLGPLTALPAMIGRTAPSRIVVAPAERRTGGVERPLFDARLHGIVVEDAIHAL